MSISSKFFIKNLLLSFSILFSIQVVAQDLQRVKLVSYNLLYYRQNTGFCNSTNNNPQSKDGYMRSIHAYVNADIYCFQEVSWTTANHDSLLMNVFNRNGNRYNRAQIRRSNNSNIVNGMIYDSTLFGVISQDLMEKDLQGNNLVRGIDFITLYYKDPNLTVDSDTVFLNILMAHTKAGNTSSDRVDRGAAATAVMDYLNKRDVQSNYLFCGDFNIYTNTEPFYQAITSHPNFTIEFKDPVNRPGGWGGNATFSDVHTQSTNTSGTSTCHSGGGMDDRFDFFLFNAALQNNQHKAQYIDGTYKAIGQDGNRFNQSLISPTNTVVPPAIALALYNMSDHLPVALELNLQKISTVGLTTKKNEEKMVNFFQNPVSESFVNLHLNKTNNDLLQFDIFDNMGRWIRSEKTQVSDYSIIKLELPEAKGLYFISVIGINGLKESIKIVKT